MRKLEFPHISPRFLEYYEECAYDYLRHIKARDAATDSGDEPTAVLHDALASMAYTDLWARVKEQERSIQDTDTPMAVGWRVSDVISWAHGMYPWIRDVEVLSNA